MMNQIKAGTIIGNSVISAKVKINDKVKFKIMYNPPYFSAEENSLTNLGKLDVSFSDTAGKLIPISEFSILEDDYPQLRISVILVNGTTFTLEAFCPIDLENCEAMFLPSVIFSITNIKSCNEPFQLNCFWNLEDIRFDSFIDYQSKGKAHCYCREHFFLSSNNDSKIKNGYFDEDKIELSVTITKETVEKDLRCIFGYYSKNARWRTKLSSLSELVIYLHQNIFQLKYGLKNFINGLPNIGDKKIWQYTRWYTQASILLTKSDITGRVITMGYKELNQRDSFWTSYIHLIFWPNLEKAMITESIRWQRLNGKIPTTILPYVDRIVDIDINEFFCLRISRYFRYHRDYSFLRECWPYFLKSIEFIQSLDRDHDGVPEQAPPSDKLNYWADWKDVVGISGRKIAPDFVLLWKAVLQEGIYLAEKMNEDQTKKRLSLMLRKVDDFILSQNNIWNGQFFQEIWYKEDSKNNYCLYDQVLAIPFNAYPSQCLPFIYEHLNKIEMKAGIPETFPYRSEMEYEAGSYHNGGIWPYLVFADAMGRFMNDRSEEAVRLIKKIGYYDLENENDWIPHEFINAVDLSNTGIPIQGWSSLLFGTLANGAFHVEWFDDQTLQISINFKGDFKTNLVLPKPFKIIEIMRESGKLNYLTEVPYGYKIIFAEI